MVALREVLAHFRIDVDGGKLVEMDKRVVGATSNLSALVAGAKVMAAAFAGSALVQGVRSFAGNLANAADEIDDLSAYLGLSARELQVWRFAAGQNGLSAEALTGAIQRLVAAQEGADTGNKRQAKAFKDLGVRYKDAHGNMLPVSKLLPEVAKGMAKLKDPTDRNAVALSLFGKSGLRLVPLLSQGEAGLQAYREELEKLGGGFSDELVANAGEYNDTLAKLDVSVDSLQSRIGVLLLPALTKLVDWMARGVGWISRVTDGIGAWVEKNSLLETGLAIILPRLLMMGATALPGLVVGFKAAGVAALNFAKAQAPALASIAMWVLFGIVIQDIVTMFRGGASVIGKFFDAIFGDGATEKAIMGLRLGLWGIVETAKIAGAAIQDLWEYVSGGDATHLDAAIKAAKEANPQTKDRDARSEAIKKGDVKGYLANKRPGQSRESALEDFKMSRDLMIRNGEVKATDMDVASGLGGKTAYIPNEQAMKGAPSITVSSPVNITVPASADNREMLEHLRKAVAGEMDKRNRDVVAALGRGKQ